jgi:hypothetical protein
MCCRDVYGVALTVDKCMKIADAAAAAAARQQYILWHQIDDEEHLLFSCKRERIRCKYHESTKDIWLRFAGLPMSSLRDLKQ